MSDSKPAPPNLHLSRHPAVLHKLAILRDEKTEPKKFREVVRELSWLLGYEALADAQLAAKKNCMACHQIDKKLVGPAYKDVAAKVDAYYAAQ